MQKILKSSKKGFTLIEMILVLSVIVVLATVLTISVASILHSAKAKNESVSSDRSRLVDSRNAGEQTLRNYKF